MNNPIDSTLLSVAEALADGMPVDWDGLRHREPALAARLGLLREVAEVATAYREIRKAQPESAPAAEPPTD
jgi:hypothetical protein